MCLKGNDHSWHVSMQFLWLLWDIFISFVIKMCNTTIYTNIFVIPWCLINRSENNISVIDIAKKCLIDCSLHYSQLLADNGQNVCVIPDIYLNKINFYRYTRTRCKHLITTWFKRTFEFVYVVSEPF